MKFLTESGREWFLLFRTIGEGPQGECALLFDPWEIHFHGSEKFQASIICWLPDWGKFSRFAKNSVVCLHDMRHVAGIQSGHVAVDAGIGNPIPNRL